MDALFSRDSFQNAIDETKGEQLLEIEEDEDYIDPEVTDDEAEASVARSSYHVEESVAEAQDASTDTSTTDDMETPAESILSKITSFSVR